VEGLLEELERERRDERPLANASSTPVTRRGVVQRAPITAPMTSALDAATPYNRAVSTSALYPRADRF
jgi:hypothetical protein